MDGPDWRATVRLEPAAEITDAIDRRRPLVAREGTVSVTELVDPRPAFFRRRSPVPVPPERRRRQAAGRALHERIGSALAAPGHREIRVRRGGIVGFVDLVEELPIELKTTERLPADGPIAESRPSYLEQLAWYCALLGADRGRLLVVADDGGRPGACRVFDVAIADRDRLLEELDRRAAALRSALAAGSPDLLPRCRWVGRGCEFASAGVCGCSGEEPMADDLLARGIGAVVPRPDLEAALGATLSALRNETARPPIGRFRDLLYPRRAYFERIAEPEEPAGTPPSPPRPLSDAYRTLVALVEAGPTGEVTRLAVPTGEPTEPVGCFRDHPYLLKVSRVRAPLDPRTVLDRQPQYLLELGLRCAAVGDGQGWLLIGHDRDGGLGPIDAFAVRFDPLDAIAQVGLDRLQGLDEAFRTRRPDRLPACPAWMATDCPYRDRCGCATPAAVDGTRSR